MGGKPSGEPQPYYGPEILNWGHHESGRHRSTQGVNGVYFISISREKFVFRWLLLNGPT